MEEGKQNDMKNDAGRPRRISSRPMAGLAVLGWFLLIGLWGVLPFNGKTLPEALAERCHIRFKTAAALVSVAVGVLGTAGAVMMVFRDRGGEKTGSKGR